MIVQTSRPAAAEIAGLTNNALYEYHPIRNGMGLWRCNKQTGETSYYLLNGTHKWWVAVPEPPPDDSFQFEQATNPPPQ